jgi:hypothetical protein
VRGPFRAPKNERRNKCQSSRLSFAEGQTTEHWFSNRGAVGLIRCINATLEHRGYVSPATIGPGLLLSEMKGSTVESMTTFDSTKESLIDLLQSVKQGKTQLPDFQRGWVWDDDHIRSLLASVSLSFPIGAVMMLQTGNPDVRFKPRLVEGLTLANSPEPERLILDGQQRLTSLFLALMSGVPVSTRDRRDKPIDERIDIHHIFPQKWCQTNGIEPKRCDCIVNKTTISAKTNRMIGGSAPSNYLGRIQKSAEVAPTRMDAILKSHVIEPAVLRSDDFLGFFKNREKALLDRVEAAMGKPIARDLAQPEAEDLGDYEDEGEPEEEMVA